MYDLPKATAAWSAIADYAQIASSEMSLSQLFAHDAGRFNRYRLEAAGVKADLSKNLTDARADALMADLANAAGVLAQRDALFSGATVNNTEQRAAMHWMLRTPKDKRFNVPALAQAHQLVHATLDALLEFAEQVRARPEITDIVNIGIGGSDLGPQMAALALQDYAAPHRRLHFVSNADGHEIAAALRTLRPESTLFLIASKTFTTAETMRNAHTARDWFLAHATEPTHRHFVGLTANASAAKAFGVGTTFGMWDWVGGRYSLWSSIGLSLAIAIGAKGFTEMLAGAHAMDEHFRQTDTPNNLPVRLALLDVWYRNGWGFSSRCIAPYHCGLRRLPAYLQQLEMESNGKGVDRNGTPVTRASSPVVWGEPGTNGQHAFFQMLHQGTDVIPVEFIGVQHASHTLPGHHLALLSNLLAQAQALMQGRHDEDGHRHFTGNRPSTVLMLEALTPASLGALIALYEHRVFVAGVLWNVNSFDQWGVELGKVLATQVEQALISGNTEGLDASTAGWVATLHQGARVKGPRP